MNAASDSRARPVRRTAIAREIGGAESRTTSAKDPLRNSTSAHHAALPASSGRTIHRPSLCPRWAQSRGASVRDASIYATHSPRSTAASTIGRSKVSLPVAPTTSVSRPRGNPPDASARSRTSSPVGSPWACGCGAGSNARSDSTLWREEGGESREEAAADFTSRTLLHSSSLYRRNTENMNHESRSVNGYPLPAYPQLVHTTYIRSSASWLSVLGSRLSTSSPSSSP